MTTLLFKNARVFDGKSEKCPDGMPRELTRGRPLNAGSRGEP